MHRWMTSMSIYGKGWDHFTYSVAGTVIITASIDASEEWDIAMVDLSGALLQSKQEGILSVRLEVIMVRLLQ